MRNQFLKWMGRMNVGDLVTDEVWDSFLPHSFQSLSPYQWTPISVVETTWDFLQNENVTSVVDLGSGVGKFCIHLSYLSQDQFSIIGLEDRSELFQISEDLKPKWNAHGVIFRNTNFLENFPRGASHYYAFNPLYETMKGNHSIDSKKKKSAMLFLRNVQQFKNQLYQCKMGTKLITYHGFGGSVLPGFRVLVKKELPLGEWMVWERI